MPELTDKEVRAILSVADALIGRAGRTTLVMALRGSRARRVLQFGAEKTRGYGVYAGVPEAEVMSLVDSLISRRILRLERPEGLPLLCYTPQGLEMAEGFAADEWLRVVRSQVAPVAQGAAVQLPFLMSVMPNRNQDTVFKLIDLVRQEADATWLPLLRAWSAVETRRARGRLLPIISALEHGASAPGT